MRYESRLTKRKIILSPVRVERNKKSCFLFVDDLPRHLRKALTELLYKFFAVDRPGRSTPFPWASSTIMQAADNIQCFLVAMTYERTVCWVREWMSECTAGTDRFGTKGEIGKSGRKRRDGGCDRTKGGKLKKSKTSEGGWTNAGLKAKHKIRTKKKLKDEILKSIKTVKVERLYKMYFMANMKVIKYFSGHSKFIGFHPTLIRERPLFIIRFILWVNRRVRIGHLASCNSFLPQQAAGNHGVFHLR